MDKNNREICDLCETAKADPKYKLSYAICSNCVERRGREVKEDKKNMKFDDPQIDQINERLFLGNKDASHNLKILKDKGITHILVVGRWLEEVFPKEFKYLQIDVDDSQFETLSDYFESCHKFIKESKVCFVHCSAGMSRSPTIVISYLMKEKSLTLNEAFKHVSQRRPIVCPNENFMRQLEEYERKLRG